MKKIIVFVLLLTLVVPLVMNAQVANRQSSGERIYNLVGTVQTINSTERSFELKLAGYTSRLWGFFANLWSLLSKKSTVPIYKIITDENTVFAKKSTSGVVSGAFSDLSVGLRVQVKGILSTSSSDQYRGIILAKNVFILTPSSAISPSQAPQCNSDSDCMWCGNNCVAKSRGSEKLICPQVMPPEGFICKCENGICKKSGFFQDKNAGKTEGEKNEIECILTCYKIGKEAKGWAWRCLDPVRKEWQWQLRANGAVNLVKLDPFCDGCKAECLYKGTAEEGYYNSCSGRLIIAGCQPPSSKGIPPQPKPIIRP